MAYLDLRDYLNALENAGKLKRISAEVDKDWEISAVGRVVFESIPEKIRPALMFEKIKGNEMPVVLGILGASRSIYALALEVEQKEISNKWSQAQQNPLKPVVVSSGPCKENILKGNDIDVFKFPIPIWTVGRDPGPYLTAPFVVTKDPQTGIRNIGTYRCQVKERNKLGVFIALVQHGRRHIEMNNEMNKPTPAAIVIGADPTVGLASVSRMAYGLDEFAVAGALRGEPLELVKCETCDLEVPAYAEIVLEGEFLPNELEKEGPFGEYTGYMGAEANSFIMNIKCITHRNNPIYQAFLSQMPPSESSCIRGIGREMAIYKHLAHDLHLPVKDVHLLESGGSSAYLAISIKQQEYEGLAKQVMWAAWSVDPTLGKYTVVVDDDIDIRDPFALNWAISFRVQPHKDIQIINGTPAVRLDPSQASEEITQFDSSRKLSSKIGIDATKKHRYPAISIPPKEHLEKVRKQLEKYGLSHGFS